MVSSETLFQNEYFQFSLILIGSIIFAQIFNFTLKKYVKRITKKTKSDIDDIILSIITKPLYILIIFIGLYLALKSLSALAPYSSWIDGTFFVITVLIVSLLVSKVRGKCRQRF